MGPCDWGQFAGGVDTLTLRGLKAYSILGELLYPPITLYGGEIMDSDRIPSHIPADSESVKRLQRLTLE